MTCTVRSSRHVTSATRTAPVVVERSSAPTAVSAARILPVLVRIAAVPEMDAERSALPVVREISACSNASGCGSSTFPVLPVTVGARYCASGRYTVIFGVPRKRPMRSYQALFCSSRMTSVCSST